LARQLEFVVVEEVARQDDVALLAAVARTALVVVLRDLEILVQAETNLVEARRMVQDLVGSQNLVHPVLVESPLYQSLGSAWEEDMAGILGHMEEAGQRAVVVTGLVCWLDVVDELTNDAIICQLIFLKLNHVQHRHSGSGQKEGNGNIHTVLRSRTILKSFTSGNLSSLHLNSHSQHITKS
jgi:hypothetical protein